MSEISHVCEPGDLIITMCAPGGCVELGLGQVDACVQMKICALCTTVQRQKQKQKQKQKQNREASREEGGRGRRRLQVHTGHTGT